MAKEAFVKIKEVEETAARIKAEAAEKCARLWPTPPPMPKKR